MEEGDFVLIELEGRDVNGNVFDTTKGELAKKLHGKEGPLLVVYGKAVLIPGLKKALADMKEGDEKEIKLSPDEAFGQRRKELIKVVPLSQFKEKGVIPAKGNIVSFETESGVVNGIVKSISNGRVMIDFNHPMAGREVIYKVKVVKVIKDEKEKIKALLSDLGVKEYEINDKVIKIKDRDKLELVKVNIAFLLPQYSVEA